MSRRLLFARFTVVLLFLMVSAIPATAQQRLFGVAGATVAEIDTSTARFGTVLQTWPLPAGSATRTAVPLVGGRYLAWVFERGEGELTLVGLDTISGSVSSVVIDQPASGGILGVDAEGERLVLWSRRLDSEEPSSITVWNVRTRQSRTIPLPGPQCVADYTLAGEAMLLLVVRQDCGFLPSSPRSLDIVDLESGITRERVFDMPFGFGQRVATNASGTRLWVGTALEGFDAPPGIAVYDVAAGTALAVNTGVQPVLSPIGLFPIIVDDRADMVLMVTRDGLAALDGDTLRLLGRADAPVHRPGPALPSSTPFWGGAVAAHADAEAIYAFEYAGQQSYYTAQCDHAALIGIDPATGRRIATRPATRANGELLCGLDLVMAVAPGRPANFRAEVSGRRVTLSWDRPAQTTHYELEAGSAPGLRDLMRVTPDSVLFVVENVPPGTYYVRVRALNYAGKGAYTEDLTVVVP